jgi:hypothetical protein
LGLTACSGKGGNVTGPDTDPGTQDPGQQDPGPGNGGSIAGGYVLERINESKPGQLVTISNPDGKVIGLYRFDAGSTLELDAKQAFHIALRYTDDKEQFGLDDSGRYDPAGPASQDGSLPLTFSSAFYGDAFTAVSLGEFVTMEYDLDGDGQMDTSFGFERKQ